MNADDAAGGSVQIHPAALAGGTYDLSLTEEEKANGAYRGLYEWCVVLDNDPEGEEIPAEIPADAEWTSETNLSMPGGVYLLYVRDAQEPENANVIGGFRFRIYSESISLIMASMLVNERISVLSWEAVKSLNANRPIREVKINGFKGDRNGRHVAERHVPAAVRGRVRADGDRRREHVGTEHYCDAGGGAGVCERSGAAGGQPAEPGGR